MDRSLDRKVLSPDGDPRSDDEQEVGTQRRRCMMRQIVKITNRRAEITVADRGVPRTMVQRSKRPTVVSVPSDRKNH